MHFNEEKTKRIIHHILCLRTISNTAGVKKLFTILLLEEYGF